MGNTTVGKEHGEKLYFVWYKMIRRCYNKDEDAYKNYGGRGIAVCEEWKNSFEVFYNFAINSGYSPSLDIDRINNEGNYEPLNVRFVTRKINCRNRRNNVFVVINGVSRTLAEWGELSGVSRKTIRFRYKSGLTGEDLIKPVGYYGHPVTIKGITKSLTQWAKDLGLRSDTLAWRLKHNYPVHKALRNKKPLYTSEADNAVAGTPA